MKETLHYVAIAMRFYADGKILERNRKEKVIFEEECETLDSAYETAKEFLMKRQWNVKNGEMIKSANEISKSDMIAGCSYCQEIEDDSDSEFWEEYIAIIPRVITWKTRLKEAFWKCIVYIFAPVFLIKGVILGIKLLKTEPIDEIYKLREEIKNTKFEDRHKIFERYFEEEE